MPISADTSSRLLCRASAYNFAASSRNLPNKASRLSLSLANRCVLTCACWVVHEVANDVRPPIAVPASAAKADMYAASIGGLLPAAEPADRLPRAPAPGRTPGEIGEKVPAGAAGLALGDVLGG